MNPVESWMLSMIEQNRCPYCKTIKKPFRRKGDLYKHMQRKHQYVPAHRRKTESEQLQDLSKKITKVPKMIRVPVEYLR